MRYVIAAESDIGIGRNKNQDSVLVKHAVYNAKEVLMAIICDGMGGLDKGELASATVIRVFDKWFAEELQLELKNINMDVIGCKWSLILKTLNIEMLEYSQKTGRRLGTTFTGVLFIDDQYVIVHVGDTRMYHINSSIIQLTIDQTYVAREVLKGTLTTEQAKKSKFRNRLLQCIGASKTVEPQVICGQVRRGVYLLCSDGFRHHVTEDELRKALNYRHFHGKNSMLNKIRCLISTIKQRGEKDNISVVLIKACASTNLRYQLFKSNKAPYCKNKINNLIGFVFMILGIILLFLAFFNN